MVCLEGNRFSEELRQTFATFGRQYPKRARCCVSWCLNWGGVQSRTNTSRWPNGALSCAERRGQTGRSKCDASHPRWRFSHLQPNDALYRSLTKRWFSSLVGVAPATIDGRWFCRCVRSAFRFRSMGQLRTRPREEYSQFLALVVSQIGCFSFGSELSCQRCRELCSPAPFRAHVRCVRPNSVGRQSAGSRRASTPLRSSLNK